MMNLLLAEEASKNNTGSIWIYVVLIVLVVLMLVLPSITNRRRMKEYNQMLDQLRVGDEVRTIGGVIGRVTKINTKGDIKTFVLETGSKGNKTTMEFDMAAVGTVLKSTYVPPVEEPKKEESKEEVVEKKEETIESKNEDTSKEDAKEVKEDLVLPEEDKKEEKPKKKTSTKKTTKK